MNPTAQLRDIHLPSEVAQWPPAYGWWLLVLLSIALVIAFVLVWIRQRRLRLARRQALLALKRIDSAQEDWPVALNHLLKRLAISYFPRHKVAALHSEEWVDFMSGQVKPNRRDIFSACLTALNQALYRPGTSSLNFDESMAQAKLWIRSVKPQVPVPLVEEAKRV